METALIIIGIAAWLISGYKFFVYWWTKDYDYTINEVPYALGASFLGPFCYYAGRNIHTDKKPKVINKKR